MTKSLVTRLLGCGVLTLIGAACSEPAVETTELQSEVAFVAEALEAVQQCPENKYCWYVPPPAPANAHSNPTNYRLAFSVFNGTTNGTYAINGGTPTPFTVTAGVVTTVDIPTASIAISAINTAESKGIFVISSDPITVSLYRPSSNSQDAVAAKEKTFSLGRRFRLGGYPRNGGSGAEGADTVIVLAPYGGQVTFEAPPGMPLPYWQGETTASVTVDLTPGQAYALSTIRDVCDQELDGALVTSEEDIVVVTGGRGFGAMTGTPSCEYGGSCGDAGFDMTVPTGILGDTHVVVDSPGSNTQGEMVRVVADVDGTEVRLNGTLVATINGGEYHQFTPGSGGITSPTLIETSENVAVYQTAGLGCEYGMAYIPPLYFPPVSSNVAFNTPSNASVLILVASASEADMTIGGKTLSQAQTDGDITSLSSNAVPGTTVRFITFSVVAGNYAVGNASADFQLGVQSYTGPAGLFGYYSPYRYPQCGDGVLDTGEGCDDGNILNFDGCDGACTVEDRYTCTGEPSVCLESTSACQAFGTV